MDTAALLKKIETLERENKELNALVKANSVTQQPAAVSAASASEPASASAAASASASAAAGTLSASAPTSGADAQTPAAMHARRMSWNELSPDPKDRMIDEGIMLDVTDGCSCSFAGSRLYLGRLIVTDLMLSFVPNRPTPYPPQYFVVDLALVEYVKAEKKCKPVGAYSAAEIGKLGEFPLSIVCKDGRSLVLRVVRQKEQKAIGQVGWFCPQVFKTYPVSLLRHNVYVTSHHFDRLLR